MTLPTIDELTQPWETADTGPPAEYGTAISAEQADVAAAQTALDAKNALVAETGVKLEQARKSLNMALDELHRVQALPVTGGGKKRAAQIADAQRKVDHWTGRVAELEGRVAARTGRASTLAGVLTTQQGEATGAQNRLDFYNNTRTLMPWLPADLAQLYADTWAGEAGNADLAMATMVSDPRFEQYFPGLRRDDGTMRLSIAEYMGTVYAYEDALLEVGVNPALFQSGFAALMRGEVSASEFRSRVSAMQTRILGQETELRQIYADFWGLDMTPAALLAGALDPTVGEDIINRRIGIAEIGGEAALQGFMLQRQSAERLFVTGFGQETAQTLFRTAGQFLPNLTRASGRQWEGTFNLDSFLASQAYSDPREIARLGRIQAGEASLFSSERTDVARSEAGAVTGLRPR